MVKPVIAIDGPAGAGKSTIAKLVAEKLNFIYIDTGAMYRAVTLKFLETNVLFSEETVTTLAQKADIVFAAECGKNCVFLDGRDVTEMIRSSEVTRKVSEVAAVAGVREAMVSAQRRIGAAGGIVMDGRDIGTVVFPNAEIKLFLTASIAERAKRRYLELQAKGQSVDLEKLQDEIALRDKLDSERKIGPLKCAEDAHYLDTSNMDIDEVVDNILSLCEVK